MMKALHTTLRVAAVVAALCLAGACSNKSAGDEIQPKSITLSEVELTLQPGQTTRLTAHILPSTAADKTIKWSSTNPSRVTVDAEGRVSAVSQGTAYVLAETVNALKASCLVIVGAGASYKVAITFGGEVAPAQLYGWPGKQMQLGAVSNDGESHPYQWSASAAAATVSEAGLLNFALGTPAGAEGYAWYGESVIRAVTPDGCGASVTAVSAISNRFSLASANATVGGTVAMAQGASAQVTLYAFDGASPVTLPATAYTLRSNNDILQVNGSTLVSTGAEGTAVVSILFAGEDNETVLCTVNVQKSSSSTSSVELWQETVPVW